MADDNGAGGSFGRIFPWFVLATAIVAVTVGLALLYLGLVHERQIELLGSKYDSETIGIGAVMSGALLMIAWLAVLRD